MIQMGEMFLLEGISEMDHNILPRVRRVLDGLNPRIPPNYALMLWFTMQVYIYIYHYIMLNCIDEREQPRDEHKTLEQLLILSGL